MLPSGAEYWKIAIVWIFWEIQNIMMEKVSGIDNFGCLPFLMFCKMLYFTKALAYRYETGQRHRALKVPENFGAGAT